MTRQPVEHRIASAAFTHLAQPADPVLARLLQALSPGEILTAIRSGTFGAAAPDVGSAASLAQRLARWRTQLTSIAPDAGIGAAAQKGIRLVCPGDPGWPRGLDDLGPATPYALWVRGDTDL